MKFYSLDKKIYGYRIFITWMPWKEHVYYRIRNPIEYEIRGVHYYFRAFGLEVSVWLRRQDNE